MTSMDELRRLQHWYQMQCNEDWEHTFGIFIETLDNPGWHIRIDLTETALERRPFASVSRGHPEDDADWITCKIEESKFVACGGSDNLSELLGIFLRWAEV
jgi:hypothetical protein